MPDEPKSKALTAIGNLFEAGRPLIYIQSTEEQRVISLLRQATAASEGAASPLVWSVTEGLRDGDKPHRTQPDGPRGVLDFVIHHDGPVTVILEDYHEFLRDSAEIRRRLRDVYYACVNARKFVLIVSPVKLIPPEIEREVAFVTLPMPDRLELERLFRDEAATLGAAAVSDDAAYTISRALQGLSFNEARHAIRFAFAEARGLEESIVPLLQEEKRVLVRRTGLIEYVPEAVNIDQLGGLDVMKRWLVQRRELFFSRDSLSAEIIPKGLLLMGVSGCGKSLTARTVASVFGLPLYRVDMPQIFAAGLGNAERLFADACRTMEEIAPAVVWFDEIENSISHEHQDSSGVLDRIFGYFLTWMQEKPAGLFVAATANRIDLLPAEMIRKGRFDQVFFIDLPDKDERIEIFRIHLARRGVDPDTLSMELIAQRTEGWTGAEIEQCVISALTTARINNEALTDKYMLPALREIVPLSKTMKEQVAHIRSWAFDRAVRASSKK
jgi:ATP-dependent 26S proteasome regulatory subunit